MRTTQELIGIWFDRGVANGKRHMLVICDTFDHSDYPVYTDTDEQCLARYDSPGEMQKVMEVYDLHMDRDKQLYGTRCMNLPPRGKP